MSLKQIILPPETLALLYTKPIIDTASTTQPVAVPEKADSIKFLGSNNKHISIFIKNNHSLYLDDKDYTFLTGILNACKLNMADIALVNIATQNNAGYAAINAVTKPEKAILFDVTAQEIGLPLQFPHFQVQAFNNVQYLCAPPLPVIEADKTIKGQLWMCLKQLFQL